MRMSQPGPRGQANAAPWRRWLLPTAVAASFVALLALSGRASRGIPLSYTQFLADVGGGSVRAVTIGPSGQVTGSLTSGQPFSTTIPVALGGNGLAGDLAAHHVQVTATAAASSSLLSMLIGLLPVLFIAGLLYAGIRGARRQAAGGRHAADHRRSPRAATADRAQGNPRPAHRGFAGARDDHRRPGPRLGRGRPTPFPAGPTARVPSGP